MKLRKFLSIATLMLLVSWPGFVHAETRAFASFDVQPCDGHIVIIQWGMTPAMDSLSMEVERSRDKITWEKIAVEPAQSSHQYFMIDSRPGDGLVYYRIVQKRAGNKTSFSEIKWVQMCKTDEIYIWPNPVKDVVYIKTPFVNGNMDILNTEGKLMMKIAITGLKTDVPVTSLSKGIYFIHIRYGEEVLVEKFIKE
ncbi:MAG: T9SS type A sorting domain-containing protein [Chitinophagaceae bacterium]|nr:T9SS type A sorting domain-containing protein [Chitinophagaceae bacterium]